MKCIYVSSFLRDIDVHLSTLVHTDVPCEIVKSVIVSRALRYKDAGKIVLRAADMVWDLVMCKNSVTVNVNQLRRDINRIRCARQKRTKKRSQTVLTMGPKTNAPPLPKGFVRPVFTKDWTPAWARSRGWIKDPYYDWLEPSSSVKPVLPSSDDDDDDVSWWVWLVILAVVVAIGYGGYAFIRWRRERLGGGQVDVDRAFLNMSPSVSMGPIDEMPNTTDLMNDFNTANQSSPSGRKSATAAT